MQILICPAHATPPIALRRWTNIWNYNAYAGHSLLHHLAPQSGQLDVTDKLTILLILNLIVNLTSHKLTKGEMSRQLVVNLLTFKMAVKFWYKIGIVPSVCLCWHPARSTDNIDDRDRCGLFGTLKAYDATVDTIQRRQFITSKLAPYSRCLDTASNNVIAAGRYCLGASWSLGKTSTIFKT